ncbi:YeeE/YedE family protein [bacterium]|nr:YeeE/YedE family protein [bacterium]
MTFESNEILMALIGGLVIGLSVTVMLLFKGRVTGISGITYNFMTFSAGDWSWRGIFLLGLVVGGILLRIFLPESLENTLNYPLSRTALAGFLVGFGTLLGNGCTSGHGVCGISRFSLRSLTATVTFMAVGILIVYLVGGV